VYRTKLSFNDRSESLEQWRVRSNRVAAKRAVPTDDNVGTVVTGEVRGQTEAEMITRRTWIDLIVAEVHSTVRDDTEG
jgi:hypothetical protein